MTHYRDYLPDPPDRETVWQWLAEGEFHCDMCGHFNGLWYEHALCPTCHSAVWDEGDDEREKGRAQREIDKWLAGLSDTAELDRCLSRRSSHA